MSNPPEPLDADYSRYERLRAEGLDAAGACERAFDDGRDFWFAIRMLREVYAVSLAEARDIAARSER